MIYSIINKSLITICAERYIMTTDLQKRTIVKTLTWRVTASLTTFIIAWVLTGDLLIGVSIGSIEAITKIFLYYFHERIWNNIKWAKA
jgi:uncharacterized membrane protein